ncbi:phytoene desaturase family protein [Humidisolicoccus flavus]|uniref:phytoene desaturase family protein n=1 Tax=Humidisolicoccus flavus TaxID=3111414 RepID=UPI00324CF336
MSEYADAVVVGSGPNGLAAAVTLARAGLAVTVYEQADRAGGGLRTAERTLPGFRHDICSAVHPMALASGFFRSFGLAERVPMIVPEISYAHPLDNQRAGIAYLDLERTVDGLREDGPAWRSLMKPLVDHADHVARITGSSLLRVPRHPVTMARFGLRALEQGLPTWNARFMNDEAPALLTGVAAHTMHPLPDFVAAAAGLTLAAHGHAGGWPVPRGGSQAIADAMIDDIREHGGTIETERRIEHIRELPNARAMIFDVGPHALRTIVGDRFSNSYAHRLSQFRYGDGAAKVDFALSAPVPWDVPELVDAGTVHLGGTRAEIARAESLVASGVHPDEPYVLVAQPSSLDASRAPEGQHTLWAYAHVPRGSTVDPTEMVTKMIERFAPGFRDTILASSAMNAAEMEEYNPNYVGGDIASGAASLRQLIARPTLSFDPWRTPARGIYLASASTPPGPGVHGLAGAYAARSALRHEFGIRTMPSLRPSAHQRTRIEHS